jgi:hypothetical protein
VERLRAATRRIGAAPNSADSAGWPRGAYKAAPQSLRNYGQTRLTTSNDASWCIGMHAGTALIAEEDERTGGQSCDRTT